VPEKRSKLVDLQVKEVSGVGSPANMRKFLIVKSADSGKQETLIQKLQAIVKRYLPPKDDSARTFYQSYAYETLDTQLSDMMYNAQYALKDSIKSILADASVTNKMEAINQALSDFSNVISSAISDALALIQGAGALSRTDITTKSEEGNAVPINDEVMKKLPKEVQKAIRRRQAVLAFMKEGGEELSEDVVKNLPDEIKQELQELDNEVKKLVKLEKGKVEKGDKEGAEGTEGEKPILKGLTPEQREYFEKMMKRVEEAEKLAKQERDARIEREFIEKASKFKYLPINPQEFGKVMKSLYETNSEQYKEVEKVLQAADKQLEKSKMFDEIGLNQEGDSEASTALHKKAEEIMKSDSKLTREQAFLKAVEQNPELYEQYKREML